jgi:glycosyltransferase involved in cell wall biosynthesis
MGLRVLMVAESFFDDIPNGLARVAWDVSRELARRGNDVALVCPSAEVHSHPETFVRDAVRVTRYPRPRTSAFTPANPWRHVAGYRDAIQALGGDGTWDVVHCHGIYAVVAAAEALPRVPRVMTIHSPAVLEQAWNWTHERVVDWLKLPGLALIHHFESKALAAATVRHSLSHFTQDSIRRIYSAQPLDPWRVIPHWVDNSWSRQMPKQEARGMLGWPVNRAVILAVRQLKPRYGLAVALRALAPAIRQGLCEFRICGDGYQRAMLEHLARSLGVEAGVIFEGRVSDATLRLCYQAADVCVVPSVALECFGLIVLEAYACGLPVVATSCGALPEIVASVTPALLVPPRDSQRLQESVAELIGHSTGVPSGALEAYAMNAFRSDRCTTAYEHLYAEAIAAN